MSPLASTSRCRLCRLSPRPSSSSRDSCSSGSSQSHGFLSPRSIPPESSRAIQRLALIFGLCSPLLLATPLVAGTLQVPQDFSTIQAAIDAANPNDVIEIAAGTYLENLTTDGKALTLRGAGIGQTIIDGSALTSGPDLGSTLRIVSGEGADTIIEQLTLSGGVGSLGTGFVGGETFVGGCLFVENSRPTLRGLRCESGDAGNGGGAFVRPSGSAPYTIADCEFSQNTGGSAAGLAVVFNGEFNLEDCVLEENISNIDCSGAYLLALEVHVRRTTFRDNVISGLVGVGAGLLIVDIGNVLPQDVNLILIESCEFVGNQAVQGGGAITALSNQFVIRDSRFDGNTGPLGGAILCDIADLSVEGSIFVENSASSGVIAMSTNSGDFAMDRCTMSNNTGSAGVIVPSGQATIRNSIFWNNGFPPAAVFIAPPTIEYSLIEGGAPGVGNLATDPLFLNPAAGNYSLAAGSPAIDAGDPGAPLDPDGTVIEIGAIPFVGVSFIRGDANLDGLVDVGDPVSIFDTFFFLGSPFLCDAAVDANDDEQINLADPIYILNGLFQGGPQPPAPNSCGTDPTPGLGCDAPSTGC